MTTPESGSAERVDLRKIWPHEEHNFTPWLAENLGLLGKAVGMDLVWLQTEASGWSGYLDILAEAAGKGKVAIENQLEDSDSDHFARLIGYAANHDAHVLVWVAPRFWEYHLKQVAWLNEMMAGKGEIYAVAVGLVPDGDLRPVNSDETAPGFRAEFAQVDKDGPEWAVLKEGVLSETNQRYYDFFQELLGDLRGAGFTDTAYVRIGNDQSFPSGHSSIDYHVGFWGGSNSVLSIYLYVATFDPDDNKRIANAMYQHRQEIEEALPEVWWGRGNGQNEAEVGISIPGSIEDSDERLDEIRAWASENVPKFKAVIQPCLEQVISELPADAQEKTQ